MSDSEKTCYIYLITHKRDGSLYGPVKVGITTNLNARLAQIQTGNPHQVDIALFFPTPGREFAAAFEQAFHHVMASKRLTGEWFDMEPVTALRAMIYNMQSGLRHFLGEAPDILEEALEYSRVNEARDLLGKIEQYQAQRGEATAP